MAHQTVNREVRIYNGHRYRRYPESKHLHHQRYFHGTEPRRGFLHRHVWEDTHGPIPAGFDIHHIDEDTGNNDPLNLECLPKPDHKSLHDRTWEGQQEHLEAQRLKAALWHASPEGLAWHSENGKAAWVDRETIAKQCECCGSAFEAYFKRARFCTTACKQRAAYARRGGKGSANSRLSAS